MDEIHQQIQRIGKLNRLVNISSIIGDTIDGYGWRTYYNLQIIEVEEYCTKCDMGNDHPFNNHKWAKRDKVVKIEFGLNYAELITALKTYS